MGLRRYRELIRIPGVAPLLLAAFVARLPYGLFALALILMLRAHDFGSAAIAHSLVTAKWWLSGSTLVSKRCRLELQLRN